MFGRLNLRWVLIALVSLVGIGGVIGVRSATAPAESSGAVHLVVDFGAGSAKEVLDKKVENFAGTGWQLLIAAGLKVQGTADYPNSFVCRINGWPSPSKESCSGTPSPTVGYWKYFIATSSLGGSWIASGTGAAGHKTECGSAEGWLWVTPESASDSKPRVKPEVQRCE